MNDTRTSGSDLIQVRQEIDSLDRQIVQLIADRQHWVVRAGALKRDESAVRAPDRVEQVVAKVRNFANDANASPNVVETTYRAMISAFIELELEQYRNH